MNIVVIGSINIDMVVESDKFPGIGETIIGNSFHTFFGGKGANQAVCAARLGANVQFIGSVGDDTSGKAALDNLALNNVGIKGIKKCKNISTGMAQITIAEQDNSIIIVKGANDLVTTHHIQEHMDIINQADLVLLQLEIPLATVEYVIDYCHKNNIRTVLNPAPAVKLSDNIIRKVTYLTPNETEFHVIFDESYQEILKKYPNKLIITKGRKGIDYFDGNQVINISAISVDVVDTTGAGDAFNGAMSTALVQNKSIEQAIQFGNLVASKSIGKLGAQTSMPYLRELKE